MGPPIEPSRPTSRPNRTKTSGSSTQMEAELVSMDSGSCGASASSGYGTQKTSQALDHKEEKKERVKQCLRELHSLMPEGSQRKGLLGTLQQVVQRMKQIKGETDESQTDKEQPLNVQPAPSAPSMPPCVFFPPPPPPSEVLPLPIQEQLIPIQEQIIPPSSPPQSDLKVPLPETPASKNSNTHHIVMRLNDGIVCEVSDELVAILGYPKDYWLKQSVLDFLCKHDLSIFTSKLSQCRALASSVDTMSYEGSLDGAQVMSVSKTEESKSPVDAFYFKLRHYKSLRSGYNLVRPDHFSVFHGRVSIQTLSLNLEKTNAAKELIVLECQLVSSAFKEPGVVPEQCSFSTKHTVFCNYCHIDEAGIPLLGYLPQDMISTSIFNYYHPEDLPLLLNVYQNVVANPKESYISPPYRMRAHNGDYILMQTNWTKQWDTIVGQHVILKGPENCNVFEDAEAIKISAEIPSECPDISSMEKLIKKLLLQPNSCESAGAVPPQDSPSLQEPPQAEAAPAKGPGSSSESGLMSTDSFLEEAMKRQENELEEGSEAGSISLSEDDLSVLYEGLSYASNIRRYLMSHGSSAEFTEGIQFSQLGSADGEGSPSTQDPLTVDVDLPLPARIPSQASSTKALVSEHEREELAPPSPAHEDIGEEAHKESIQLEQQDYMPIRLSTEALKVHDKIHERFFIEKMMKEKAGYLLSQAGSRMLKTIGRSNQKRHQQDHEQDDKMVSNKFMRQDDGQAIPNPHPVARLQSPFPITSLDTRWTNASASTSMAYRHTSHQTGNYGAIRLWPPGHLSVPPSVYPAPVSAVYPAFASIPSPVSSSQISVAPTTTAGCPVTQTSSMMHFWPLYAQHQSAAVPMYPSMPSGQSNLCPPGFVMAPAMAIQPTVVPIAPTSFSTTQFQAPVSEPPQVKAAQQKTTKQSSKSQHGPGPPVQSVASAVDMDFSTDCTDSSLLYLLETSTDPSQNQSAEEEERHAELRLPVKQKIRCSQRPPPKCMDPPWKQMVNWTKDVQMRYEIPQLNSGELLKQDSMSLKLLKQPVQLTQQLDELLSYIGSHDKDSDSQEDVLLMSECALATFRDDSSDDKAPLSPEIPMQTEDKEEEEKDKETKSEEEEQRSESSDLSSESPDSPPRPKSTDKLSENEGSDSNESSGSSHPSSDLTPSESRSNEEVASSIKESDNASSSDSIGKDASNLSSESENDSKNRSVKPKVSVHKKQDYFSKLFVPMRVWYEDSSKQWMSDVEFSENMQMLFQQQQPQQSHRSPQNILVDDKQILDSIGQPELVRLQMNCLLQELEASEADYFSSSSLSSRDDRTESAMHTDNQRTSVAQQAVSTCQEQARVQAEKSLDKVHIADTGMYQCNQAQSTTSGFSSMSNNDSCRGNSSSSGDKISGASSSNNNSDKDKNGSGSSKESSVGSQGGSADPSHSSNSDPDDKAPQPVTEAKMLSPIRQTPCQDDSGEGGELPGPASKPHGSGSLAASAIEKLDTVMSVFSLKEAMNSQHMELLQE